MKIRALLIVVPLIILALALAGGSVLILRLFFLSILVPLLGYLWARLGIRGLDGQVRTSSKHCQAGEWFNEEITVFNRSKVPKLLIKIQENTDLPGHHNVAAFNLSSRSSHCWRAEVYCQRRGLYSLGTLTATVTDPFGFFSLHCNFGEPQSILVYPMTLELPFFQPLSRNEPGHGPSRWLISETGADAARVREYVSGDTLNRIHWHSTAHTGKLMVKEFDADRSTYASKNVWIIPDMHQASQLGDGDGSTEEYCVTIAASLLKKDIDSGKQAGLMAAGDQSYLFSPQMGSQHLWSMLEALALMKATGEVPIEQLISYEIERFGINSVIIVITPSVSERIVATLRQLRNRGASVVAILVDPVSFGGEASAANAASSLILSGLQAYIVRHGEELTRALDSRVRTHMRYVRDVV